MRAVLVKAPGGVDALELGEVPAPVPSAHQALIEVHAAGVNRADLLQRRGLYPPPPGESTILGLECAGVVCAVGREVTRVAVGDRVMALIGGGGYAELAAVDERLLLPIPAGLAFTDAAALPEAFLTAYEALLRTAELGPGERVLIHAAASGVGTAALQLAREIGAYTFASSRAAEKAQKLRDLGADRVIDTSREDFRQVIDEESGRNGVDVILDLVGAAYAEKNQASLAAGGRWVVVGLVGGSSATIDFARLLQRRQKICGIVMRTRPLAEKAAIVRGFGDELLGWLKDERLRPIVDCVLPLSDVRAAHERMEQNQNVGKIVLAVR
jgi:NADPH2:quinone reductase